LSSNLPPIRTFLYSAEGEDWRRRLRAGGFAVAIIATAATLIPGTASAQRPLGVDVSDYQGTGINWSEVKSNGVTFAWTKATQGASGQYVSQASFTGNESRGKTAGLYMGAYHYCETWQNAPATEESYFWSVAGGYILADGKTLMPMLDFETFSGVDGAASYSAWLSDWCADVVVSAAANGVSVKPAIYSSVCTGACDLNSSVAQWGADLANYNGENVYTGTPWSECTSCEAWGSGVWNFWQVSDTGSVGGISGAVDLDGFNGTAATLLSGWVATAAASSVYYWDPQGTSGASPYTGSMTGTWENNDWSTSSAGQASPTAWVDGKAACFGVHTGNGTPAFTVTMNSSHVVAGFFDGSLTPNSCNVTITGSGTISLASGAQGCDVHNASDGSDGYLTINNVIAGNGQLVPESDGQIYLNGVNTYSGGTQLGYTDNAFSGIINFNNGSSFGTGPITLSSLGNGAALVAEGGTAAINIPNAVSVTTAVTNNFVGTTAGVTYSGNWTLGGNLLTFETGNTAGKIDIISGVISGTAGLTVSDDGTLELSGTNTYTGTTTIVSPAVFTIAGAGQLNSGAYGNSIVNGGTFNYSSTASQSLSGVISGAGPLNVNGGGALTLTGVNTYSGGTTVNSGSTLSISADSAIGSSTAGLTLNGGCLKNNNSSPTLNSSRTITLGANGGYFDAGWAPTNPITINSKLTGSGQLLINLDGSPVVLANTANNYTGNTIIGTNGPSYYAPGSQAWLKLGASGVIPNGSGNGNVFIYQVYKGLLDLAGFTQTINGLSGDGTVDNSAGNGSLSIGNNNQSSTFNGVIQNTVGNVSVTKVGSGTLALGGANTYTGNTAVNAGTLALNGGSIGASVVTVAANATLANVTTNVASIGGATTLNSGALASFTAVGGSPSVLGKISVTGNLNLNENPLTINVSGAALSAGTYRLMDCTGTLSGTANATPTITGTPLPGSYTAAISTTIGSAGHVDLVLQLPAAVFSNLTTNQTVTYGTASVLLSGTVSAPGPVYPTDGEMVSVTINSNAQLTAISDSTGDFSINYSLSSVPASGVPYVISYYYGGDGSLNATANTNTTLTLNPLPVALTGTRPYNGTTTAAAGILSVTNKVGSDVVTVASGSGTLASANVGTNAISSVGTLALGGSAANNYTLAGAAGSVIITTPPFTITGNSVDATGSNFIITWQSAPGATYHVIGSTNITAPLTNWPTVAGPIVATQTNTSVTNPISSFMSIFDVISP